MREAVVKIRFVSPCLGNVKASDVSGRFFLPRNVQGFVQFMPSWYAANARLAAKLLGRHQDDVKDIHWGDALEHGESRWFRRYYVNSNGKERYCVHEAFLAGDMVSFRCAVPSVISDEDLRELLVYAGRYSGLSPWRQDHSYGRFDVILIDHEKKKARQVVA